MCSVSVDTDIRNSDNKTSQQYLKINNTKKSQIVCRMKLHGTVGYSHTFVCSQLQIPKTRQTAQSAT